MPKPQQLENSFKCPPKKYFRYVVRGANYFHCASENGCSLRNLIAYAYLKNQKADRLNVVERHVRNATKRLVTNGVLKRGFGNRLSTKIVPERSSSNHISPKTGKTFQLAAVAGVSTRSKRKKRNFTTALTLEPDTDEQFNLDPDRGGPSRREPDSSGGEDDESGTFPHPGVRTLRRKGRGVVLPGACQH
ncbi:uncharacterized protein LOC129755949 [Uranotaenia lowii]|uniref:uncharacterized protein LOC129755949 n=1 Tax=Uranotaenia lowii TaxID=190385 RepID=UPI00247A34E4|nr:uncharacterized protein LOC129755949 [Uranotaenia lowii]